MTGDIIKLIDLNTGDAPADIYLAEKETMTRDAYTEFVLRREKEREKNKKQRKQWEQSSARK